MPDPVTRPAKCRHIFDPNEWVWFQGGLAKGVKLGAYTGLTPEFTTQLIGCRGDAEGKKTDYVNITETGFDPPEAPALDILETALYY